MQEQKGSRAVSGSTAMTQVCGSDSTINRDLGGKNTKGTEARRQKIRDMLVFFLVNSKQGIENSRTRLGNLAIKVHADKGLGVQKSEKYL